MGKLFLKSIQSRFKQLHSSKYVKPVFISLTNLRRGKFSSILGLGLITIFVMIQSPARAQNKCAEIFTSKIFRSSGYFVDSNSPTRIAVLFDPAKVKPESAELVVAEFKELAALVGDNLAVPKSILIKLQHENSAAYNAPHFMPQFVIPVEFSIDPKAPLELQADIAKISSTVRIHEFSHGIFDATLSRDLPSYKMISNAVKEALKGDTFEERYQAVRQYVNGTFGRPAKMSPDDPRYPKAQALLEKMYKHSSNQSKVQIKANSEIEAIYGPGNRAEIMLRKVTAIHELFADILASIQMDSIAVTRLTQETSGLPVQHPFIIGRAFDRNLSPDDWKTSEPHLLFGPTRSFLGPYLQKATSVAKKQILILKIYTVLKEKARHAIEIDRTPSPQELNEQLILDLKNVLDES